MATQLKKVVAPTGGDYTALETCMNANEQNLVTADKYFDVEISGTWSSADTTAVNVHNYTTDATRYINIYTTGSARHTGKVSSNIYHLYISGGSNGITTANPYITINGLYVETELILGGSCITPSSGASDNLTLINNILKGSQGIGLYSSTLLNINIYNNIIFNSGTGFDAVSSSGTMNLYNNTVYGCTTGISRTSGTVLLKNNIAYNNTTDYSGTFSSSSTNNLSKDTTAPPYNTYYTEKTLSFVSTTAGSEDFHLASTDTDALRLGADLSATFKSDIDGMWRGSTWSIGADQRASFVVAPTGGDYTALETCMNAQESDITAKGFMNVEISGTWASDDTTAVTIHNYTTDATRYINIYTTGNARHSGKIESNKYAISVTNSHAVANQVNNVTIDGLIVKMSYYGYVSDCSGIYANWCSVLIIKNNIVTCLVAGADSTQNGGIRIETISGEQTISIYNNIVYGFTTPTQGGIFLDDTANVFNNTLYNNNAGFLRRYAGTPILKNNLSYNNTTDYSGTVSSSSTNNLSKDTTAPAYNTYYVSKTVTFTNTTAGSEDFHLVASDTDAIDKGADLSGTFTTDIDGQTRSGTWDIGADEYIVTGYAWGEQNPTGEIAEAWSTWDDGAAGAIIVSGDASWGKFVFDTNAIGHSPVKDFSNSNTKIFTITKNKYGTGSGSPTVYIRGDTSTFTQDAASPSWEQYTGPIQRAWRYVQVKLLGT